MALAISEARKGFGFVSPNPPVGCVILDSQNHLLAVGYHHQVGQAHAEIDALNQIQDHELLRGAQVFVTLEPCSHFGRTPPCAEALAKLPIAKVIFGLLDPNPKVSGRGAAQIRERGIECVVWSEFAPSEEEIQSDLEDLAEIFLFNQRHAKVFVALKVATSLDGQMALATGESKWITGEEARTHAQFLRAQYDAILIGARTFELDNPQLNVRLKAFEKHQNAVVIIDPDGKSFSKIINSNLAKHRPHKKIFLATCVKLSSNDINILKVEKLANGQLNLLQLLELLWQNNIKSVFVEGGAHTYGSFLEAKLINRLYVFMAPVLIGRKFGVGWTDAFGVQNLADKLELSKLSPQKMGQDLFFNLKLSNRLL